MPRFLLLPHEQETYRRAMARLLDAHDILGRVRIQGWVQAQALGDVYGLIEQAVESLAEISPQVLGPDTLARIQRFTA